MNDDQKQHDQRQYSRMQDCIQAFEGKRLNMSQLISDLHGLMNALQAPDPEWVRRYYREWAVLDDIYAIAADEGHEKLPPKDRDDAWVAIAELKKLIQQKVE